MSHIQVVSIMNEAAVSIVEQISLWYDSASFGFMPKSGIEESCGN